MVNLILEPFYHLSEAFKKVLAVKSECLVIAWEEINILVLKSYFHFRN